MRTFSFQLVTALFVFLALGWTSGGQSARSAGGESGALSGADFGPQPQLAELTPVASARAPLSLGGDIALPSEGTACVIESYDYRIHCVPRDGGRAAVFGRRGQGPGEFPSEPSSIVRGPGGTIGVVSIVRRRLSVYEPSGDWGIGCPPAEPSRAIRAVRLRASERRHQLGRGTMTGSTARTVSGC